MENKKLVDMEIGSQAFSKDGNWQVIRRFKIIEEGKQPKYRYVIKCLKCGYEKEISQGHFTDNHTCQGCKHIKYNGSIINHYKILNWVKTEKGKSYYKVECLNCNKISVKDMYSIKTTKFCNGCRSVTKDPGINLLLRNYKSSAKKRNYSFELTPEQFENLIKSDCYYCGSKSELRHFKTYGSSEFGINLPYNGIDRFDNTKGYTINNCVPCCGKCNIMKSTMSFTDFKSHIIKLAKHLQELEGSTTIEKMSSEDITE